MKISQIIIVIIVVLIATTVLTHISIIPSREVSVLNESGEETSDTDVSVAPPEDLSSVDNVTINPPEIKPPYSADEGKVESAPAESELADESKPADESVAESAPMVSEPKVEEETKEEIIDKIPETMEKVNDDKIEFGTKDESFQEIGPSTEENQSDIIIDEDCSIPKTEDGQKDVIIKEEESRFDEVNKNKPEYKPSIGGNNPFNNDTKTEINDRPVEDYVGDGENRPGEGIHF